ncbi:hypothetical protein SynPROS91_00834 [Synechococcus sp. PROS-9-1]|nr:hypothetical protein SynPROS91_00834 [Synechococcus sp. PROS-9-1]
MDRTWFANERIIYSINSPFTSLGLSSLDNIASDASDDLTS